MAELPGECKGRIEAIRYREITFRFADIHFFLLPSPGLDPGSWKNCQPTSHPDRLNNCCADQRTSAFQRALDAGILRDFATLGCLPICNH